MEAHSKEWCPVSARTLGGQIPAELAACSVEAGPAACRIRLRAHFDADPSEAALEDMLCVETEIFCDCVDDARIETEIGVMALGRRHACSWAGQPTIASRTADGLRPFCSLFVCVKVMPQLRMAASAGELRPLATDPPPEHL